MIRKSIDFTLVLEVSKILRSLKPTIKKNTDKY